MFLSGLPARVVKHHLASLANKATLGVESLVGFSTVDHRLFKLALRRFSD